jgi:hypothetical protein
MEGERHGHGIPLSVSIKVLVVVFFLLGECTGWSKSTRAPDDYSTKNTQKYFKQFQSLVMITKLELGIIDGVSVSLVSPWPWRSAAKQSD